MYSVDKVKKELLAGKPNDPLRKWAQALPPTFFKPDQADPAVMTNYGQVVAAVLAEKQYNQLAKNEFAAAARADAFLIAAAKHHGAVLVTQEKSSPQAIRTVPIPNAAALVGVQTLTIFEMLNEIAEGTFELK